MTKVGPLTAGESSRLSAGNSRGKSPEKSGHLTLTEIAQVLAQTIVNQHQELTRANELWVYATDRDELLDFHGHQSVNANPSNNLGKST